MAPTQSSDGSRRARTRALSSKLWNFRGMCGPIDVNVGAPTNPHPAGGKAAARVTLHVLGFVLRHRIGAPAGNSSSGPGDVSGTGRRAAIHSWPECAAHRCPFGTQKELEGAGRRTLGASSGASDPRAALSGITTALPSLSSAHPRSAAETSMPKLSTPRSLALSTRTPVPGVTHPTGCRYRGRLCKVSCCQRPRGRRPATQPRTAKTVFMPFLTLGALVTTWTLPLPVSRVRT